MVTKDARSNPWHHFPCQVTGGQSGRNPQEKTHPSVALIQKKWCALHSKPSTLPQHCGWFRSTASRV